MTNHLPKTIVRNPQTEYYLVDVECLYDTRLILLSLIDEAYAAKALEDGTYFQRPSDAFEGLISYEDYRALYAQRGDNPELIRVAPNTNFHMVLNAMVRQSFSIGRRGGTVTPLGFVINMWPYNLVEEEVQQFKGILFEQMGECCDIHAVWIPPEELTPAFVSEQYNFMAMYDAAAWLVMHGKELVNRKLRDFFLTAPAVYLDKIPTEEELKKIQKDHGGSSNPFLATEATMAPCISLQFLDVEFFSILNEHRKLATLTDEERDTLFKVPRSLQKVLDDNPLDEDLDNILIDDDPTMEGDGIRAGETSSPADVPPKEDGDATRQS